MKFLDLNLNSNKHTPLLKEIIFKITGIKAEKISLQRLKGDASERSYSRVKFQGPGKSSSLIIMDLKKALPQRETLPFIAVYQHLKTCQIPVPEILWTEDKKGIIFLEDLGDTTLEIKAKNSSARTRNKYYRQAIDLLLKMQSAGTKKRNPSCPSFHLFFDREKLMAELNFFLKYYLGGFLAKRLSVNEKKKLKEHFLGLSQTLAAQKRYFTHRDYHSRNIMILPRRKNHSGGKLKIIDFQDARMGPCQYDLASLLRDSYFDLGEDQREKLLEYYLQKKEALEHKKIERNEFRRIFDYMSLQRNLKALGTFGYQTTIRKNKRYLNSIPLTLSYLKENLNRYPELRTLRDILLRYI